nr:hypothetical protein 6 [Desulfobulbaceae bacterium]
MVKRFKGASVDTFHELIDQPAVQHGTPPPSDQQAAESHPDNCHCIACFDHYHGEQEQADDSNQLWNDSILNENHD